MTLDKLIENNYDNVFKANHRNKMIEKYGYCEAHRMIVEFNKQTKQAEVCSI